MTQADRFASWRAYVQWSRWGRVLAFVLATLVAAVVAAAGVRTHRR